MPSMAYPIPAQPVIHGSQYTDHSTRITIHGSRHTDHSAAVWWEQGRL